MYARWRNERRPSITVIMSSARSALWHSFGWRKSYGKWSDASVCVWVFTNIRTSWSPHHIEVYFLQLAYKKFCFREKNKKQFKPVYVAVVLLFSFSSPPPRFGVFFLFFKLENERNGMPVPVQATCYFDIIFYWALTCRAESQRIMTLRELLALWLNHIIARRKLSSELHKKKGFVYVRSTG